MSYSPHLREGQPAQRRVSHRRVTGDSNGLTGDDESVHVVSLGIQPPAARGRGNNEVSEKASVGERGEEFNEDLMVNIYSSPLAPTSIRDDIWFSIREGAWYMLLSTLVGMVIAFFAVVRATHNIEGVPTGTRHLQARRIPSLEDQLAMHDARVRGATTIFIGRDAVILQGLTTAPKEGHLRLPNQFYQGVHFGLSGWGKWGEQLGVDENKERNRALRTELERLDPRPSTIYSAFFEDGTEGFTLAYIAGDLAHQQGRSVRQRSDPVWLEAEREVLAAARRFQQLVVMRWYPGVWGPGHEHDPDAHTSILQEVRPTRTGLRALASTVAVHRGHRAEAATSKILALGRSTANTKRGGNVVALGRGNAPQ